MVLEHYISELLYRYQCVVVPQFGAFLAHKVSARLDTGTHTFMPPTKALAFNGQLTSNDGLLATHMAQCEQKNYDAVLEELTLVVAQWKKTLARRERLSLNNIGDLWLNEDGNIQFLPVDQINYRTTSFGLTPVQRMPVLREQLNAEVAALEETVPFMVAPETRDRHHYRPYLKYAALLLLAFSTGITGYRAYTEKISADQMVRQEAQRQVSKQIQQATFFDAEPVALPPITLGATTAAATPKDGDARHHIIAGAFRFRTNADRKIAILKEKGFEATYYGTNAHGLHMVSYDRFQDAREALVALREIKRTQSPDAWLLSESRP
ncbi:SPOR domain-containing protein [Maribacter sp. 2307ULW6-5]|uniref:HU domain-containing protein n=1 Tax=Maribacter sp. 2307ULW6-5 TaxID=3386275 RepID=UPI0039BC2AD5